MAEIHHIYSASKIHHVRKMMRNVVRVFPGHRSVNVLFGVRPQDIPSLRSDTDTPLAETVTIGASPWSLFRHVIRGHADLYVFHGEFFPFFWFALLFLFARWRRIVWICWGAGREIRPGLKGHLVRIAKRITLPRLRRVIALSAGDSGTLHCRFGCRNVSIVPYYDDAVARFLSVAGVRPHRGAPRIQVGNNAAPANGHIEVFEALAVLHQCPVEVICPFSYGGTDTPYASRVRQVAEKAPMRVVLVEELLAPEEFNQLLEDCDILVINSRKQRAMFSIAAYLLMGRPVFLPDDGDLARDLRADGFLIRPLHALASLTCEGLRGLCDHGDPGNREVARQLYSIEPIIAAWSRVLSGV